MSLIDQTSPTGQPPPHNATPRRDAWMALRQGLRGRCPACGKGRILHSYLKVNDACPACGEELHHHRADDFPPYITMLVVGHVVAATMLFVDDLWPDLPMAAHFAIWPPLCVVLCLSLLPVFKSALIAYQWALRMHGFETAHLPAKEPTTDDAKDAAKVATIQRSAA